MQVPTRATARPPPASATSRSGSAVARSRSATGRGLARRRGRDDGEATCSGRAGPAAAGPSSRRCLLGHRPALTRFAENQIHQHVGRAGRGGPGAGRPGEEGGRGDGQRAARGGPGAGGGAGPGVAARCSGRTRTSPASRARRPCRRRRTGAGFVAADGGGDAGGQGGPGGRRLPAGDGGRACSPPGPAARRYGEEVVANSAGTYAYQAGTTARLLTVVWPGTPLRATAAAGGRTSPPSTPRTSAEEAVGQGGTGARPPGPGPRGRTTWCSSRTPWTTCCSFVGLPRPSRAGRAGADAASPPGKLGQRLLSEAITLRDDPLDPAGAVDRFDFEGVPKAPGDPGRRRGWCGPYLRHA